MSALNVLLGGVEYRRTLIYQLRVPGFGNCLIVKRLFIPVFISAFD